MVGSKKGADHSQQVFRQFAWNLAGTLAKPAKPARPKSSVAASAVKR